MKKRIALLLVLVLALTFVLASCGKCKEHVDADIDEICDVCGEAVPFTPTYLGFEGYYNTAYESDEKAALATAAKIDALSEMSYVSGQGNLAIFRNVNAEEGEKKLAILNLDTGAVVYSLNQEKTEGEDAGKYLTTAEIVSCGESYFIRETYKNSNNPYYTKYEYTLYTALGVEIASVLDSSVYPQYVAKDFFSFNGAVYFIEDDVVTKKFDNDFIQIPYYDAKTDKYYYDVQGYTAYIFDQNFKLVDTYKAPYNAENSSIYVLADGNLLIQNQYILPEDAAEFDYKVVAYNEIDEAYTYKYDIETLIYNVETKETVEYNVNYVFYGLMNKLNEEFNEVFVADKLDNVAAVYEIVNGEIDFNAYKTANIRTSDLKILGYLAEEIPEQSGIAQLIDDNRFVVRDRSGKQYIIDEKATVLGEVTRAQSGEKEGTFVSGTKVYDSSLNLIVDKASYAKYHYYSGIVYTYKYQIKNAETDRYETKTEYYYKNADGKMVKIDLDEKDSIRTSGSNYFAYTDVVVENKGTENEKTTRFTVVVNDEGTEIFRLSLATTSTGEEGSETGKVNTSSYVSNIETLNNGSIVIYVNTTVETVKTGAPVEFEYKYDCYLAK